MVAWVRNYELSHFMGPGQLEMTPFARKILDAFEHAPDPLLPLRHAMSLCGVVFTVIALLLLFALLLAYSASLLAAFLDTFVASGCGAQPEPPPDEHATEEQLALFALSTEVAKACESYAWIIHTAEAFAALLVRALLSPFRAVHWQTVLCGCEP